MKRIILSILLISIPFLFLSAQNEPVMTFEKTVHNFGDIKKGHPVAYEFVFTNTGRQPIFLSKPRSSCGCTVPTYSEKPIMPGQKSSITIEFDAAKEGPFNKQVTIISNAENSPVILIVKGTVLP